MRLRHTLKSISQRFQGFGFNPRALLFLRHYPTYRRQRREWLAQGGEITRNHVILSDYSDSAGIVKGHYFHQDLLVAGLIAKHNPIRHLDVGSRIDGFVAHVASYREIEVVDIRPLPKSVHENIKFVQADLMNPANLAQADSVSCLHALEHFGLGRYTDPIDVEGHLKGVKNLVKLVKSEGRLYLSVPIGMSDEVHFNAHRVFHPKSLLSIPCVRDQMMLERFDYVDDQGHLHSDTDVERAVGKVRFGCGIYSFKKTSPSYKALSEQGFEIDRNP